MSMSSRITGVAVVEPAEDCEAGRMPTTSKKRKRPKPQGVREVAPHPKIIEATKLICRTVLFNDPQSTLLDLPLFDVIADDSATRMWMSLSDVVATTGLSASKVAARMNYLHKRGLVQVHQRAFVAMYSVDHVSIAKGLLARLRVVEEKLLSIRDVDYGKYVIRCKERACRHQYWVHHLPGLMCELTNEPVCLCGGKLEVVWTDTPCGVASSSILDFIEKGETRCAEVRAACVGMLEEVRDMLRVLKGIEENHAHIEAPDWYPYDKIQVFRQSGFPMYRREPCVGGDGDVVVKVTLPGCATARDPLDEKLDGVLASVFGDDDEELEWEDC